MGEYAEAMLRFHMRSMPINPNWQPRKRPRCSCVVCQKEVEASEGLAAHIKSKHKDSEEHIRP